MEGEDSTNNLRVASFSCYLNTAEENLVHKLAGALQDHPLSPPETLFPVSAGRTKAYTIKPTSNTHLLHSPNSKNVIDNLRLTSFSPYLNTPEDNFVFNVPGAAKDPVDQTPFPIALERNYSTKEGEISIFGAEKYFNLKMDNDRTTKYGNKKEGCPDMYPLKPNFKVGTPSTVVSESSSLSSGTALLSNLRRNPSQTRERRPLGKKIFSTFGCNSPCSDKKAVYISVEHGVVLHGTKQSQPGLKTGNQLEFPMETFSVRNQLEEEAQRKSLEVFGSAMYKKGDIAANLARKLSMLTWDAIPEAQNLPTNFGSSTVYDDMASDASSDLFEIENISGTGTTVYPLLTRQASDNMSSCMSPTTHYEPSEASIEWSVVTASCADFSAVSDYEGINIRDDVISSSAAIKAVKAKNMAAKDAGKSRPGGGLLGCRSHKVVRVAEPAAHKISDQKAKQEALDSSFSFRKL